MTMTPKKYKVFTQNFNFVHTSLLPSLHHYSPEISLCSFLMLDVDAITRLVMLLLSLVYMDLDEVDDNGGVNSAIPIGANIGDDHVSNAPAGSSVHGS